MITTVLTHVESFFPSYSDQVSEIPPIQSSGTTELRPHRQWGLSFSGQSFPTRFYTDIWDTRTPTEIRVLRFSSKCFQRLLQDESLAQNFAVNLSQGHRKHKSLLIWKVGINVNLLFLFFCERKGKKGFKKTTKKQNNHGRTVINMELSQFCTQSIIQPPKWQSVLIT